MKRERNKGYQITRSDRFLTQIRYFTDSGIIGSRKFVIEHFDKFKDYLKIKNDRKPKLIQGLDGIYSMRRLGDWQTYDFCQINGETVNIIGQYYSFFKHENGKVLKKLIAVKLATECPIFGNQHMLTLGYIWNACLLKKVSVHFEKL